MRVICSIAVAALVLAMSAVPSAAAPECASVPNRSDKPSDFDADGFNDLPVGAPLEDIGELTDAGIVQVLYSESGWGVSPRDQIFSQDSPGVPGRSEAGDRFGGSVATGDFNRDGYCDLAIGGAYEDVGDARNAGRVWVLYGTSDGLRGTNAQSFSQETPGIAGVAETGDHFGFTIVAQNFGNGGYHDLAIGVPGENIGRITDAGQVHVLYGSSSGLRTSESDVIHQDTEGLKEQAEADDDFGNVLAAGDLHGNGQADLVIGVPHEDVGAVVDAGLAHIVVSGLSGMTTADRILTQDTAGVEGEVEERGLFGYSVAPGYFVPLGVSGKAWARRDLAIGAPGATVRRHGPDGITITDEYDNAGQVHVFFAGDEAFAHDQLWTHQDSLIAADDLFGYRLASGDLLRPERLMDLAIAAPYSRDLSGGEEDAGVITILHGTSTGLQFGQLRNGEDPLGDENETIDNSGRRLGFGGIFIRDFGRSHESPDVEDSPEDMAVGGLPTSPYDSTFGSVYVDYLLDEDNHSWSQGSPGIRGGPEPGDLWGWIGNNHLHDQIIEGEQPFG